MGLTSSLVLAYYAIQAGELSIGDFVLLNSLIIQMYTPLSILGTMWRFIRQSMVDVEMVLDLLEIDEIIKEPEHPLSSRVFGGEIEFRNVSFTYDKKAKEEEKRMIIENLSFKVPAGKSVAIVGQTGSGKSTIVRLLYRFYDVDGG